MANCILYSYNARRAKANGKKLTFIEWLILWRSDPHVHSEFQFSQRYGGISFSATLQDGCKCCRFKQIGYKHKIRWDDTIIPMTDEEEDRAWQEACRMADITPEMLETMRAYFKEEGCYYGDNAIPYDILGQPCHISKWNIWKPTKGKIWCSRAVNEVIIAGKGEEAVPKLVEQRAELMPTPLFNLAEGYFDTMGEIE